MKLRRLISFPHQAFLQALATLCLLTGYFAKPANATPLQVNTDDCTRGDLNQNGLGHEIADFILFENYFVYGDTVLSPDSVIRNAQICNSDVNDDGFTLRVSDLVSLKRVITGESNPLPKPTLAPQAPDTFHYYVVNQDSALIIASISSKDIGGIFLHLAVAGTIGTPIALDSNLLLAHSISPGELRLLFSPSFNNPDAKIPAGWWSLLYIPFDGSFQNIEVQASTFTGEEMETVEIPIEPIDDRGDLNLNGLGNEIADFILYENYFIYGDVVLSSNPNGRQAQIAASDVNGDGAVLRVSDLVYMGRIITGDANPLPKPNIERQAVSVDFQIIQEADRLLVSYDSPVDIRGIFLRLHFLGTAGEPVRLDSNPDMDYGGQVYPGEARYFIASSLVSPPGRIPAGSGPLLSIPLSGNLRRVEIQVSDTNGFEIQATGSFPIDQRGDLNGDSYLTPSDVVRELYCIFQNPSPNCPLIMADLNCDGSITAADGVNIINATFLLEPLPICSP